MARAMEDKVRTQVIVHDPKETHGFNSPVSVLCEDSARGVIHVIDNRQWCVEHCADLRSEPIQDTFQYVKAAHPFARNSQFPPVANHSELRTRSVADLALWADAVVHTCCERPGFQQLTSLGERTRAQYASMGPASIASIALSRLRAPLLTTLVLDGTGCRVTAPHLLFKMFPTLRDVHFGGLRLGKGSQSFEWASVHVPVHTLSFDVSSPTPVPLDMQVAMIRQTGWGLRMLRSVGSAAPLLRFTLQGPQDQACVYERPEHHRLDVLLVWIQQRFSLLPEPATLTLFHPPRTIRVDTLLRKVVAHFSKHDFGRRRLVLRENPV